MKEDNLNIKEHVKSTIRNGIDNQHNITEVVETLEREQNKPLSLTDIRYIERKYIKYCCLCFINEIQQLLGTSAENEKFCVLQSIFDAVYNVQNFEDLPQPLNQLKYYGLLLEQFTRIDPQDIAHLFFCVRAACLHLLKSHGDLISEELLFFRALLNFLHNLDKDEIDTIVSPLKYSELSLTSFLQIVRTLDRSDINFLLRNLQDVMKPFLKDNLIVFKDQITRILKAYLKPTTITTIEDDDRRFIEVEGGNIVISKVLPEIEEIITNDQIEEVRFVAMGIAHIDANLKNDIWHGKNVIVKSTITKIYGEVNWDVSGKSTYNFYSSDAGTSSTGEGKAGANGVAGESGGHLIIQNKEIKGARNLKLVSCGGNGSDGQDGGPGRDGKNGIGISCREFKKHFRGTAFVLPNTNKSSIGDILEYISSKQSNVNVCWHNGNLQSIDTLETTVCNRDSIYVDVKTKEGHNIIFSSFFGMSGFCLYTGTEGEVGGTGGKAGLGGAAGYAGEIDVDESVVVRNTNGEAGRHGKTGLNGKSGINGWDVAFTDYIFWGNTVYHGMLQNSKLILNTYSTPGSDRFYCPYYYVKSNKNYYVEISTMCDLTFQNIPKKYRREVQKSRENQTTRKKYVSRSMITERYGNRFQFFDQGDLQKLESSLKNLNEYVLQLTLKSKERQQHENVQLGVVRKIDTTSWDDDSDSYVIIFPVDEEHRKISKIEYLNSHLKWLKLEIGSCDIQDINITLSRLHEERNKKNNCGKRNTKKLEDIRKLLMTNYQLYVLETVGAEIQQYYNTPDNLSPETVNFVRCFVEVDEGEDNGPQSNAECLLREYFLQHEESKISDFLKIINMENNVPVLKHSLIRFLLEEGKNETAHLLVKVYYDQYNKFIAEKQKDLDTLLEPLKIGNNDKLKQLSHLLVESLNNVVEQQKLYNKLQKNTYLRMIYHELEKIHNKEFDWQICLNNKELLAEYRKEISKGLLSSSCRELLANCCNVNLRLYKRDQRSTVLLDNHNPSVTDTVHILQENGKFIMLKVNEKHMFLEMERRRKANIQAQILVKVESLQNEKLCDNYLKDSEWKCDFVSGAKESFYEMFCTENEEQLINEIIKHFSDIERQRLKSMLKNLSWYSKKQAILPYIAKRFSAETCHISFQELATIINSILSFIADNQVDLITISWIFAAYPQKFWTSKIILLKLENYFKQQLPNEKWSENLCKIDCNNLLLLNAKLEQSYISVGMESIERIIHFLSHIEEPDPTGMDKLDLIEWLHVLNEKYWRSKLLPLMEWKTEELETALYYIISLENTTANSVLIEQFMEIVISKYSKLNSSNILCIGKKFLNKAKNFATLKNLRPRAPLITDCHFLDVLSHFHSNEWNLSSEALKIFSDYSSEEWVDRCKELFFTKSVRSMSEVIKLIMNNENNSKNILDKLPAIQNNTQKSNKYLIERIVSSIQDIHSKKSSLDMITKNLRMKNQYYEVLNVIDEVIKKKKGFNLKDTQKLTVLALLNNDKNTLAQVSTGEGKSLIIVAVSIIKVLCGENVDVITSSSVLAKRDAKENMDIYDCFNVTVADNCEECINKRKEIYSLNRVVYGDLSDFQRDYLLGNYYQEKITSGRNLDNVIIDEVDNMLLDKGNNVLYLSHEMPGLDKLDSVYIFIWEKLNTPITKDNERMHFFRTSQIKEEVLYDLYGRVTKEDLKVLEVGLSDEKVREMWNRLVELGILGSQGELIMELSDEEEMEQKLSLADSFYEYKSRIKCLLKSRMTRDRRITIPNYLKPFVERHLESWIENAKIAFFMQEGDDYIIDTIRTDTKLDPNIVIIDRDTGTDQSHSHWDEALHQFLQLKHGCKVSPLSLKAVFISNISYLKLYNKLYGLTGTLGVKIERDLLAEIHDADFIIVPAAKAKQFVEEKPILCDGEKEWVERIRMRAQVLIRENRSVLIICETVNDVKTVKNAFDTSEAKKIYTYIRDYEKFDIAQKGLNSGEIIIATNLAGRGTDIKITKELEDAGGLHICLTYLPKNTRVEQQAFGRTARKGCKGTGQLIIIDSKGAEHGNSMIAKLKNERNLQEIRRIESARKYYESRIKLEEETLKKFYEQYADLKKRLENGRVNEKAKEILLKSCLDRWALWLDENVKRWIGDINSEEAKKCFDDSLNQFLSCLKELEVREDCWSQWVQNLSQILMLAKYFASNQQYDKAVALFDKVIKEEPAFCEAAHYYKVHSLINKKKKDKNAVAEWKKELRQAERLFNKHIESCTIAGGVIDIIKDNDKSIINRNSFKKQYQNQVDVYYKFIGSIKEILGDSVTPKCLESYMIHGELAEMVHNDLIEGGILKPSRVATNISEVSVKEVAMEYELSYMKLYAFLSQRKGAEVKKEKFIKELKQEISMPNREKFWKLLKENALHNEIKYVRIDMRKLKRIDPSLAATLENFGVNQIQERPEKFGDFVKIFLYPEQNNQEKNDAVTIEKKEFKSQVGKEKYKTLKNKGILSLNKEAYIDPSKIKPSFPILPVFDSIALNDLMSETDITYNEAEEIMKELVDRKILEKASEHYRLLISYKEIHQIQIHCHSVYQKIIRHLISKHFAYREALQILEQQMEMWDSSMQIPLMPQTHQALMESLIHRRIIKLPTITKKICTVEDFKSKLQKIYAEMTMSQDKFLQIFSQSGLIPAEKCTTDLLNYTIQNNLVYIFESYEQKVFEEILQWMNRLGIINIKEEVTKETICNIFKYLNKKILITNTETWIEKFFEYVDKRTQNNEQGNPNSIILIGDYSFNKYSQGVNEKIPNSMYVRFEETIKSIIETRLHLSRNDTIEKIAKNLQQFRGILKTSDTFSCNLKPFIEVYPKSKLLITQELQVFIGNGLSEFLVLEKNKWSIWLLTNTAALLILGTAQLVLGVMLQCYTTGIASCVSNALYGEGICDIAYAIRALLTGNFSWSAYRKHKFKSVINSALYIKMGNTPLSVLPNIKLVIDDVIRFTAVDGVNFLLKTVTHPILQALTKKLCRSTGEDMDAYDSAILKEVYAKLGKTRGMELIHDVTNKYVSTESQSNWSRLADVTCSLMPNIKNLKGLKGLNNPSVQYSSLIITAIEKATCVVDRRTAADIFKIWEKEVKERLDVTLEGNVANRVIVTESEAKEFEREVMDMWKEIMFEKITEQIENELITPISNIAVAGMMRYINKSINSSYASWKSYRQSDDFNKGKQELQKTRQNESNKKKKDQEYIDKAYEKNIRKLQKKDCPVDFDIPFSQKDIICTAIRDNQINEAAEKASPYQHNDYKFNNLKDVDLRENKTLTDGEVRSQIERGINVTLKKINQNFHDLRNNKGKVTFVKRDDFVMKRSDPVNEVDPRTGKIIVKPSAVEINTVIRLNTPKQGKVKIKIGVCSTSDKVSSQGPHGPHIEYEMSVTKNVFKSEWTKQKGYVLLDKAANKNEISERC